MTLMPVTLETSHCSMGWFNALAKENIKFMPFTLDDTFHYARDWLKDRISENMEPMRMTLETWG